MAFDLEMACHNARARVAKAICRKTARAWWEATERAASVTVLEVEHLAQEYTTITCNPIDRAEQEKYREPPRARLMCAWRDYDRLMSGRVFVYGEECKVVPGSVHFDKQHNLWATVVPQ